MDTRAVLFWLPLPNFMLLRNVFSLVFLVVGIEFFNMLSRCSFLISGKRLLWSNSLSSFHLSKLACMLKVYLGVFFWELERRDNKCSSSTSLMVMVKSFLGCLEGEKLSAVLFYIKLSCSSWGVSTVSGWECKVVKLFLVLVRSMFFGLCSEFIVVSSFSSSFTYWCS